MTEKMRGWGPATCALYTGETTRGVGEPVTPGPAMSASFLTHPDAVGFSANDLGAAAPHFYTRWSNPTVELLETRLAALEGGEAAVAFASGMAAVNALFSDRLASGDHLVLSDVCYAGVAELAQDTLVRSGIAVTTVDTSNPEAVAVALRPNTRLVHIETPANPILRLADVAEIARIVHAGGAELSVDATIATPLGLQPLALGADYVVHSLTKYICGHGDALGGAVIGGAERMAALRRGSLIHLGACLAPFQAWLILRGLETLVPRLRLHEANARAVEAFLADHPKVRAVHWPGSPRHPQHALAQRQMRAYSGLLAFSVHADGAALARRMAERMRVISYAVSLGKTKSLLVYIPTEDILRSSFRLTGAAAQSYRDWTGEGTFRFSVGLEDAADIIADLEEALG
ncbi:Cystathionine gamma-synthase [Rhodovastum atsumiense]|uniref:Cystathionine gamma-synthase n=1 Tax=Rhodovastum atsumiense TaxID=504468 RepID=A0A5M6IWZ0_9PROT|nr:PLP-dependent transferase [Rhodovastum atsumiense]KAA5611968.1 cystathionine gamma-synthase [Rhodovastum atsumiense]CAH2598747.1 Cystathionine gamma-synthase [Rhodovastum atsumiense]